MVCVDVDHPNYYAMDEEMPLHRLAKQRMNRGRDLKIIITAKDSQTGVGKTTCAGWLALTWTKMFGGHDWFVDVENPQNGMGTLNPKDYFQMVSKIGEDWNPGTVLIVDDAEELDARRSMQNLNVDFSQRWMLMRLKQAITIITLPSPAAVDSRLEELADVWINIEIRGRGIVHDIRVQSYGNRNVMTQKSHKIMFPNIADHPELQNLRQLKEEKMVEWEKQESEADKPSPKEVKKETKIQIAQRLRESGMPIETQKPEKQDISSTIGMSQSWISKNTTKPEQEG